MSEKQYTDPIYDLDGKISVSKAIPFGLQHILAMFVANIAPILIVAGVVKMPVEQSGALVQSAMLVAGIGTLIQLYPCLACRQRFAYRYGHQLHLCIHRLCYRC